MQFADSHIHLDDPLFGGLKEVGASIAAAKSLGVTQFMIPGTTIARIPAVVERARYFGTYFGLGLHPWFMAEHGRNEEQIEGTLQKLEVAIIAHQPDAIGECGLDFMVPFQNREAEVILQKQLFIGQVKLAKKYALPLIIHTRKSLDETLKILRQNPGVRGVFHSVNGSLQQITQALDLGFYLGFGGAVTYSRAKNLQRLLRTVPQDRLLIETDGPYQPSRHLSKGATHLPRNLYNIARDIAIIRGEPLSEIAAASIRNLHRLFTLEME